MSTSLAGTGLLNLTVPSPGLDDDVWDTIQNNNTFTEIAQALYAAREDRNLTITGGGKISWASGTNQVSFTDNIVIRDHVTDKTVTITTAASPVTLSAANTVGYIQKNREPASNQSITTVSTAAAGALPDAVGDNGNIVLFHRTSDGTLFIPWARREILSGDHWQFGAATSWYEKLAVTQKPVYRSNPADTSQLVIPGSATLPAVVLINGKLYANTSDVTVDLDTAGRNGLDTGAKAADTNYYLYAIPAVSGRTFDGIISLTAPTGAGPSGFTTTKSYCGGLVTGTSSALPNFNASNGNFIIDISTSGMTITANSSTITAKTIKVPTTAYAVHCRSRWTAVSAAGVDTEVGATSSTTTSRHRATTTTAASNALAIFRALIITAQTIYVKVSNTTVDAISIDIFGWDENVMGYE